MATALISHAADIDLDLQNSDGNTLFHIVIQKGYFTLCKILFERGARYDRVNNTGKSPIDLIYENPEVLESLSSSDELEVLFKMFLDPDEILIGGLPPLIYAINKGDVEMVDILLKYKANINAQDYFGNTALHVALKMVEKIFLASFLKRI